MGRPEEGNSILLKESPALDVSDLLVRWTAAGPHNPGNAWVYWLLHVPGDMRTGEAYALGSAGTRTSMGVAKLLMLSGWENLGIWVCFYLFSAPGQSRILVLCHAPMCSWLLTYNHVCLWMMCVHIYTRVWSMKSKYNQGWRDDGSALKSLWCYCRGSESQNPYYVAYNYLLLQL